MGCSDCHKYNGRRWIGYVIPLQRAIKVQSEYVVHNSSTAAACCILHTRHPFTSHQDATCVPMRPQQPVDSLY